MDPTQTLIAVLEALALLEDGPDDPESVAHNRAEAIEGLRDLADWMNKGGFPPKMWEAVNHFAPKAG